MLTKLLRKITQKVIDETLKLTEISKVYLLTRKSDVELEGEFEILKDRGEELNDSIANALQEINEDIIVIIMADLPLITSHYIQEIINQYDKTHHIVLAPSEDKGTSIICFRKNEVFPKLFGKNSSLRFKEYYENLSIEITINEYIEAYRDIDTFKDLIEIVKNELLPTNLQKIFKECVENGRKDK